MLSNIRILSARLYLAIRKSDQLKCVIKLVEFTGKILSLTGQQLIFNEAAVLQKLKHKNIVKCYGYGIGFLNIWKSEIKSQAHYLVLEHLEGGSLHDVVKKFRLDSPFLRKIFINVAKAIKYIHSAGFFHRDIKPENLMFDSELNIKIIDFGLASPIMGELSNGLCYTMAGSKEFWAPEIYIAEYPLGFRPEKAEVFSLGVTFFVMIFGFYPLLGQFNNDSFWYYAYISTGIPIDLSLLDLLRNMLMINPNYRSSMAQVLSHPWLV